MRSIFVATLAAAVLIAGARSADAQITAEAAKQKVEETYAVEVLRTREGEVDGRPVWLVTTMNSGGNYNDAFQVNTLAIDQATGELVPSYRNSGGDQTLPPVISGAAGSGEGTTPLGSGVWR